MAFSERGRGIQGREIQARIQEGIQEGGIQERIQEGGEKCVLGI